MFLSRVLRGVHRSSRSFSVVARTLTDEQKDFKGYYPDILKVLMQTTDIPEIKNWYAKVVEYNTAGGKCNRGLTVVSSCRFLKEMNNDEVRLASILGWCNELLQAFFLVIDDVLDNSSHRRGKPSWHALPEVGPSMAINDGLLLETSIYCILEHYFANFPCYTDIISIFHRSTQKTIFGQSLDLATTKYNFDQFTSSRYKYVVRLKTGYYTFYLPVACAMYFCGIRDPSLHAVAKDILYDMGEFFQAQDDYLDVFGDTAVTGKVGTDIIDRKCSWLAVVALERCSPEQMKIFMENYGKPDETNVETIKKLYLELGLPTFYRAFEEECFNRINKKINLLDDQLPHILFHDFLSKIYKRSS